MVLLPFEKIYALKDRFAEIEVRMSECPPVDVYLKLTTEYTELKPVVAKINAYDCAKIEEKDLRTILSDKDVDQELMELAKVELLEVEKRIGVLENEIQCLLLPKDVDDEKSLILEIRAGTGGSEAALFVGDLFRMYERYAVFRKWKVELLSASEGDAGGYKEIIATISGRGVLPG